MQDVQLRKENRQLEFVWRGTKSYGDWADIWSYAFGTGVCPSSLTCLCHPEPFQHRDLRSVHTVQASVTRSTMRAGTYYMPEGFSLGKLDAFGPHEEHIIDDPDSTEPLNVDARVGAFVKKVLPLFDVVAGNDIMLTMGGDFDWNNGATCRQQPCSSAIHVRVSEHVALGRCCAQHSCGSGIWTS